LTITGFVVTTWLGLLSLLQDGQQVFHDSKLLLGLALLSAAADWLQLLVLAEN